MVITEPGDNWNIADICDPSKGCEEPRRRPTLHPHHMESYKVEGGRMYDVGDNEERQRVLRHPALNSHETFTEQLKFLFDFASSGTRPSVSQNCRFQPVGHEW